MSSLDNAYSSLSRESYDAGRAEEAKRIITLIQLVIERHEFADYVNRSKDWQGDPNLANKLVVPKEILFLLTGENK